MREASLWTLISDTASGLLNVEHEWSYIDPFGNGKRDGGLTRVSVEDFLAGCEYPDAKEKLHDFLSNMRQG
jgi:hypothetical protein